MADMWVIGQPLPDLEEQTPEGQATPVQARLGPQNTLLYFLHGTWCPVCVGKYHLLQRYLQGIRAAGADLIVVTGDDLATLTTFLFRTRSPAAKLMVRAATWSRSSVGMARSSSISIMPITLTTPTIRIGVAR